MPKSSYEIDKLLTKKIEIDKLEGLSISDSLPLKKKNLRQLEQKIWRFVLSLKMLSRP